PFFVLGRDTGHRFSALLTLPIHLSLVLLVPLIEVLSISLLAFVAIKPLAIRAYVRDVQQALEHYRVAYTLLPSLNSMYKTSVTYYQHTPEPPIGHREESTNLQDVLARHQDVSLVLMGEPGMGKTIALLRYQILRLQQRLALMRLQQQIPIYLPLVTYSLFLKG